MVQVCGKKYWSVFQEMLRSYLACSQIWLNLPVGHRHIGYIIIVLTKKEQIQTALKNWRTSDLKGTEDGFLLPWSLSSFAPKAKKNEKRKERHMRGWLKEREVLTHYLSISSFLFSFWRQDSKKQNTKLVHAKVVVSFYY